MLGTGAASYATAINDNDVVVGNSQYSATNPFPFEHAFRWTAAGGMVDLGDFGGEVSQATSVNAEGRVVGWAGLPDGTRHAFRWTAAAGMQ